MKMNNGNSILDLNFHLKSQNRINYLHRMKQRKKAKRWCLRGCDCWNSLGSFMNQVSTSLISTIVQSYVRQQGPVI